MSPSAPTPFGARAPRPFARAARRRPARRHPILHRSTRRGSAQRLQGGRAARKGGCEGVLGGHDEGEAHRGRADGREVAHAGAAPWETLHLLASGKSIEVLGQNAPTVQEQNGKFRPRYPLGEAEIGPERNRSMSQRRASRRREAPRSRTLRGKRRSGGRLTLAPYSPGAEPLQRYGLRFLLATLYNYRGHAAVALGNRPGSDERARGAALPAHRPACAGGEQSMKRAEKLPFFDCAYSSQDVLWRVFRAAYDIR